MASEFTLIDDIIKNHNERMLNLRKFYPFFMLSDNTFAQYKDGRFRFIDMGYMALAILRFFINENSFNDKPVTYSEYSEFCLKTIKRDFDPEGEWSDYSRDELNELVRYIFEKLRNNGYKRASLAVQKENYAVKMYRKVGFEEIDENDENKETADKEVSEIDD